MRVLFGDGARRVLFPQIGNRLIRIISPNPKAIKKMVTAKKNSKITATMRLTAIEIFCLSVSC